MDFKYAIRTSGLKRVRSLEYKCWEAESVFALYTVSIYILWPEDHVENWHDEEQEEPEPEGDVDFVIDHVDREDTETIKSVVSERWIIDLEL